MVKEVITMLLLTILQNASFTLMSRARMGSSLGFHLFAAVCSNTIWIFVIRTVVLNLSNPILMIAYVVGSVTGSLTMHFLSMNYIEKWVNKKRKNNEAKR